MNIKFALILAATLFCNGIYAQANTVEISTKNYTTIESPPIIIVGIECRTSNAPDAAPNDIPKLWMKFCSEKIVDKIPNKISDDIIALYCNYEGDYTNPYSLIIGCQVNSLNDIPDGLVGKQIPSSKYAVFSALGEHPNAVIETWNHIWNKQDLNRRYTGDFELYNEKFYETPQCVDIYIAID